ncbi:MAG: PEP/pyruvate-binding domain-containing protein [Candidatus Thorarchaeota archaeon]
MKFFYKLDEITENDRKNVGGKGFNLSRLQEFQIKIPKTLILSSQIYDLFVDLTGLKIQIPFLINKKKFADMRWEEIWDLSINIRNLFLKSDLPTEFKSKILEEIKSYLGLNHLAIRSSSIFEDSPKFSFAGLHESFINVSGENLILKYIKLVWASLWSNTALLYRNELNLDIESASIAVIIQNVINGEVSGIAFGKDPNGKNNFIIEAVYGLNQALVDGSIEPDRWVLERGTGKLIKHHTSSKEKFMALSSNGVIFKDLPQSLKSKTPLNDNKIKEITEELLKLEKIYKNPQEIEWTIKDSILYTLQCRPITTIQKNERGYKLQDQRSWYLSLVRNFEDLKKIRDKVENEYFPEMTMISEEWGKKDLFLLSDEDLSKEIEIRWEMFKKWKDIYWHEFIPLAHGIRLFGKVYNEFVEPDDPTEFTSLLSGTNMISTQRNQTMRSIASRIKSNENLKFLVEEKKWEDQQLEGILSELKIGVIDNSADLMIEKDLESLMNILLEMSKSEDIIQKRRELDFNKLREDYINSFPDEKRNFAQELLKLGRDSYRLRDDDNIYLGKIEKKYIEVINEGKKRLINKGIQKANLLNRLEIIKSLRDQNYEPEIKINEDTKSDIFRIKARQIIGQAASSGIARGIARVIIKIEDIFQFKNGEILIIDSIEPNMTFIVPLAAGIVERRGGILVHGAIIAREYEIPCVTGVPDATHLIKTGDLITVDGYLGIVIIQKSL